MRATLVFDGGCSSCSWFAWVVESLDTDRVLRVVPMQDQAIAARLQPRLGERYEQAFHLVDESTGGVRSGEDALLALARMLPAVRPAAEVVFRTPLVRRVPGALYRAAARARTWATPAVR